MSSQKHIELRKLIREELIRLNESRMVTFSNEILYNIGKNVPDLKRIDSNSMVDGAEGLYRYKDGNAYEIQIRPVEYANDKANWRKYTSPKTKTTNMPKITTEDMKQALWLAFKETADKIDFIGDTGDIKFKIVYNETFDLKNLGRNIQKLSEYGVGDFIVDQAGRGYVVLKHKQGTGEKSVFDELIKQQSL